MQKTMLKEVINEIIEKIDVREKKIDNRELLQICEHSNFFRAKQILICVMK